MTSLQRPFLDVQLFTYEWTIDSFSDQSKIKYTNRGGQIFSSIESPRFPEGVSYANFPKWSVILYPNGCNFDYNKYIGFGTCLDHNLDVCAKFKISILNDKREKLYVVDEKTSIFTRSVTKQFNHAILRDIVMCKANGFLSQDKLKILCEVSVVLEDVNSSAESNIVQFQNLKHNLSDDFGMLFDSKQCCDITLATGGQEIKAHKAILIARSKVFAAMFQHEMEEQKLNRVTITDIDHEVLTEMLRYMYTDKAPNLDTMALDLLAASDKYALENLKVMCEASLGTNISNEKAASILIVADRHNAKQLKAHTIDFIITNAAGVMETRGWKDMITTHAHLIAEAFCAMAIRPQCTVIKNELN